MRKDIMSVLDLFRDEGLRLRLPDDQRHDHHRGARRSARGAGGQGSSSTSASRLTVRRICTTPRAASRERSSARGGTAAAAEAARRKGAPLRVSINTTVAHESLDALDQMVDVARGARRRCDRPEPSDVQHARRSRGDRSAHRCAGRFRHRDLRHARSGARRRARARQGLGAGGEVPRTQHPVRLSPQGHAPLIPNYYTPGAQLDGRCLYRSSMHACRSPARSTSARSFGSKSATSPDPLEEVWNGETYVEMRGGVRTASSRSAGAAARWSSRRAPVATAAAAGDDEASDSA